MTNSEAVSLLMNSQYYKQGYKQGVSDVLDKIRADIYEEFMTIDGGVHDESAKKCMRIIDKYRESEET